MHYLGLGQADLFFFLKLAFWFTFKISESKIVIFVALLEESVHIFFFVKMN